MSAAAVISQMLITFLDMPAYEAVGIALASDVSVSYTHLLPPGVAGAEQNFGTKAQEREPFQNWAWVQGVMSPVLEWLAFPVSYTHLDSFTKEEGEDYQTYDGENGISVTYDANIWNEPSMSQERGLLHDRK